MNSETVKQVFIDCCLAAKNALSCLQRSHTIFARLMTSFEFSRFCWRCVIPRPGTYSAMREDPVPAVFSPTENEISSANDQLLYYIWYTLLTLHVTRASFSIKRMERTMNIINKRKK